MPLRTQLPMTGAARLSDEPWFWVVAAAALVAVTALAGRYPSLVEAARRSAARRGLVSMPPGRALASGGGSRWSDASWLAFPTARWVIASPWIWGYHDRDGAVVTDVVTGAAVLAIALAGLVLPALWAFAVVAGLWLVTAPWFVGYGDASGPVGLSDSVAGVLIAAVSLAALSAAERQLRPGMGSSAFGRLRRRD